jgi:hypothetical protein
MPPSRVGFGDAVLNAVDLNASLRAPRRSDADARLRRNPPGSNGGIREEMAVGANKQQEPSSLRASLRTRETPPSGIRRDSRLCRCGRSGGVTVLPEPQCERDEQNAEDDRIARDGPDQPERTGSGCDQHDQAEQHG